MSQNILIQKQREKLTEPVDASSLAFFRIVFGVIMLVSTVRFLLKGWVDEFYIKPVFFFKYFGFEWVQPLPGQWMYVPWILIIISLAFIIIGKFYRVAIIAFFVLFSYTELLDLTNYLNHYYLITLLSFVMIFLPMNASFSLDSKKWQQPIAVPRWTLTVLRLQVGLVYFFAGLSKIKYDWLIEAEPMTIWLRTNQNIPVVGHFLAMPITAYIFSWVGMLFDLTAAFFLMNSRTRPYEYVLIVLFHLITLWLFHLGIFPVVMMGVALVFFSPDFHRKILEKLFFRLDSKNTSPGKKFSFSPRPKILGALFVLYFLWQGLMPLRYLLYKGNVLWTEQGYRYSWNVMLMEKNGYVEFSVMDKVTGQRYIEYPKKYLTPLQEKTMSTQPDMILQYAHFLDKTYFEKLKHPVAVYADVKVALNQRSGQTFIDPNIDLSEEHDTFASKGWILSEKE